MKKLHLELADLNVESFQITEGSAGHGTVQGHYSPRCGTGITCDQQVNSCADVETCGAWATCDRPSCHSQCPLLCGGGGGSADTWCASNCADCATEPNTYCSTNPCLCG